jgi:hypothetical protein
MILVLFSIFVISVKLNNLWMLLICRSVPLWTNWSRTTWQWNQLLNLDGPKIDSPVFGCASVWHLQKVHSFLFLCSPQYKMVAMEFMAWHLCKFLIRSANMLSKILKVPWKGGDSVPVETTRPQWRLFDIKYCCKCLQIALKCRSGDQRSLTIAVALIIWIVSINIFWIRLLLEIGLSRQ